MKKMFLGLGSALLVIGSVMGMNDRDEISHVTRSKSLPNIRSELFQKNRHIQRSNSAPVTNREIQAVINKWSYLVPKETQDGTNVTRKVNDALEEVVVHTELPERIGKMKILVTLICNPANDRAYANYAHMVFVSAIPDCDDEERNKLGGMLATIASRRDGGGGTDSSIYWEHYSKGYYNTRLSSMEDEYVDDGGDESSNS
jgi:hypothetical protein